MGEHVACLYLRNGYLCWLYGDVGIRQQSEATAAFCGRFQSKFLRRKGQLCSELMGCCPHQILLRSWGNQVCIVLGF